MRQKFIKFMKQNHAWTEWKNELRKQNKLGAKQHIIDEALSYLNEPCLVSSILEDGNLFFHDEATKYIEWSKLHWKWLGICSPIKIESLNISIKPMFSYGIDFGNGYRVARWGCGEGGIA